MDDDDIWGFDQADRDNLIDMCSDDDYFDNYHQQMYGLQSVQPPLQVGGQLRGQYFYFDRIGMKQCKKFNKASTWYKWKFHDQRWVVYGQSFPFPFEYIPIHTLECQKKF